MSLWIPISVAAACMQVVRTGLQKSLKKDVDDYLCTWARFIFVLPFVPFLFAAVAFLGGGLPTFSPAYFVLCFVGGAAQIIATLMLLALFSRRNFAVSTTFAKTEGVQIALLGALVFAEPPSLVGGVGIVLGGLAVFLMTPRGKLERDLYATAMGLGCGLFFALTAWCIRLSYQEMGAPPSGTPLSPLWAAVCSLAVMVTMQALMLWVVLLLRRANFVGFWRHRRRAFAVGVTSLAGSFCWYAGFALTNPAYVKTVAQIELPLAYFLGRAAFSEKASGWEAAGMTAAAAGAVLVAFA